MNPKKIRVTNKNECAFLTTGEVYDVVEWHRYTGNPQIEFKPGTYAYLMPVEWEPVPDFKHGDPVWAWDDDKEDMKKGIYLCENPNDEGCTHMVMWSHVTNTAFGYKNVKHIKPTITIEELAKRADIDLNEYEIIE